MAYMFINDMNMLTATHTDRLDAVYVGLHCRTQNS